MHAKPLFPRSIQAAFDRLEHDRLSFAQKLKEQSLHQLETRLKDEAKGRPEGFMSRVMLAAATPPENPIRENLRRELDMNTFDRAVAVCRELARRSQEKTA